MGNFPTFLYLALTLLVTPAPAVAGSTPDGKTPDGMVLIKSGCFKMGTTQMFEFEVGRKNDRERPVHEVCVDAFYLDKYEVTNKQWSNVMGFNLSTFTGGNYPDTLPVDHSEWEEAFEYCAKTGHRLPTEAEWEYAARAGSNNLFPWGNEINGDYLWYAGNSARQPHPVGTKKPNAFGVYDMIGSVWEWVNDWYSDHYYKSSPKQNPKGPEKGSWHVIRGGSWVDDKADLRVGIRHRGMTDATLSYLQGLRCAHDVNKPNRK